MKIYNVKDTTPLKYHAFNIYLRIPLGILNLLASIINPLIRPKSLYESLTNFEQVCIFLDVITLILLIITFMGFIKYKAYGYHCFYAFIILTLLGRFLTILYACALDSNVLYYFSSTLGICIYFAFEGIYYWKRRYLFIETPAESDSNHEIQENTDTSSDNMIR